MKPRVTLVSNSPGEVSTFVRPVAEEIARKHPDWVLDVALVPCPYATGAEAQVIRAWGLAATVFTPFQTVGQFFRGRDPGPGAVVFLGGDPWHALLLKWRFQVPALAYFAEPHSWETASWLGGFDRILAGYPHTEGLGDAPRTFIGDLRVDAVLSRLAQQQLRQDDRLTLAVFPGSRWLHLKASMGPFLHVIAKLFSRRPELRLVLSVSPYVSRKQLADACARPVKFGLHVTRGRIDGEVLVADGGAPIELVWGQPYQVITECDLALCLPGTNTAELAIAGKPTVVPLSDRVPIGGGGLLGILDRLPGLRALKKTLRYRKYHRLPFLALPNRLAGRAVVPEFFVRDDLEDLFDFLVALLDNAAERQRIGEEARAVMGPPGAAKKLVEAIEAVI